MIEEPTKEQREGAIAYEELWVPALFGQWAKIVSDEALLGNTQQVLDVACGTGVLTREVASRLKDPGQVTGIDPNPGMLSVAMEHNQDINWVQGPAEDLPFPDRSFDAVLCQFGLMFFTDRVKAIREMSRVVSPEGKIVVTVWDALENIPAYSRSVSLIEKFAGSKAREALNAPFELGDKKVLQSTFKNAGTSGINISTHMGTARFPDIKSMIEADVRGWLPVIGIVLKEDEIQEIFNQAADLLSEYISPNGEVTFDITAHVVTHQT
jgi:ubiquinone/menaquinone biosynthesis C-methylase UbiE